MSRWNAPRCRHTKDIHRGLANSTWVETRLPDGRKQIACKRCGRVYGIASAEHEEPGELLADESQEPATVSFALAGGAPSAARPSRSAHRRPPSGGPSAA